MSQVQSTSQKPAGHPVKAPAKRKSSPDASPPAKKVPEQTNATSPAATLTKQSSRGKAEIELPFVSDDTEEIIVDKTEQTVIQQVSKMGASKGVNLANQALMSSSARLGQAVAMRTTAALGASVPIAGATVSAISAKSDLERAQCERKEGHQLAALAFGASSALNGIDAGLGALSAGSALTGVGVPVAAVLEGIGWATTGLGLAAGIGGEYLSHHDR